MAVEFEQEQIVSTRSNNNLMTAKSTSVSVRFLLNHKIAKSEKAASKILLIFTSILIIAAGSIYYFFVVAPTYTEVKVNISEDVYEFLPPSFVEDIRNQKKN
jgi:hypothetical protein